MSSRTAGLVLIPAAALFWLSWLLMPGVGVTDSVQIFDLVSRQRSLVMLSVVMQLVSAALYVPALLGISSAVDHAERYVRWGIGLLLLGAMGSAIDAILHLLAYAMTAPGLDPTALLPVMTFMQGPGLRLIAPLIISFFAGSILLAFSLSKVGAVSRCGFYLQLAAIVLGVTGGIAASSGYVSGRVVGLLVLAGFTAAQATIGVGLIELNDPTSNYTMEVANSAPRVR